MPSNILLDGILDLRKIFIKRYIYRGQPHKKKSSLVAAKFCRHKGALCF